MCRNSYWRTLFEHDNGVSVASITERRKVSAELPTCDAVFDITDLLRKNVLLPSFHATATGIEI